MLFLLEDADHSGAFNLTAPEPVTNRAFCDELRQHMRTWLAMPVPGLVMRIVFGEMAEELLLNGQRVIPRRLQEAGFNFRYDSLAEAMPSLVAKVVESFTTIAIDFQACQVIGTRCSTVQDKERFAEAVCESGEAKSRKHRERAAGDEQGVGIMHGAFSLFHPAAGAQCRQKRPRRA